ncbi:MAG TPA: hypothetical protein VF510_14080 [Ktedonobacterales bacterium]
MRVDQLGERGNGGVHCVGIGLQDAQIDVDGREWSVGLRLVELEAERAEFDSADC